MPVPNTIADLNQAAAANSPLGTDTVGPNLDDYLRAGSAFIRQLFDGTPFGLSSLAGTDTITGTSSVPFTAYVQWQTFRFLAAGANTTSTVTLNINGLGAKNITRLGGNALRPGDIPGAGALVTVTYDGTQFQLVSVAGSSAGVVNGQCRLSVTGTTTLRLDPFGGGNTLIINGVPQAIPAAGVTYTLSGLSASTTYYVYAYMNAGVMTLEVVTTSHGTAANGLEVKLGDTTRTLVGMVRTNASTQFVDTAAQRFCANWYNRRVRHGSNTFAAQRVTVSSSPVEISSTERSEFLFWANETSFANISGTNGSNGTGNATSGLALPSGSLIANVSTINAGAVVNISLMAPAFITGEGYSYITLIGAAVPGFTASWSAGLVVSVQLFI